MNSVIASLTHAAAHYCAPSASDERHAFTSCMMFALAPKELDYSRTRQSEARLYRATIRPDGDSSPRAGFSWTLHVQTSAGASVDARRCTVDGGMPQHGHGLPTSRASRARWQGDHPRRNEVQHGRCG